MTRPVPDLAVRFISRAEGSREQTYLDQAGRLTGGTGHLLSVGEAAQYPVGSAVPQATRDAWLQSDLQTAAQRLEDRVGEAMILQMSDHQYAALLSFVFNVGAGPSWTIWKVLRAGNFGQVPAQLMRFDRVRDPRTGREVPDRGLERRRMAERALWNTPDLESACAIAATCPLAQPSSYYRDAITPPATGLLPAHFVASAVAKGGTVVGGVGSAAASVQQQIAPHADVATVFHTALTICVGITIACGVLGLAIHNIQAKEAAQ